MSSADAAGPSLLLLERIHEEAERIGGEESLAILRHDHALAGGGFAEHASDAVLLGIRSKTRITAEALDAMPRLEAIGCFCIGTNQVDLDAAARRGIPVFNSPFSNTRSVAEITLAEIIGLHRRLGDLSMHLHQGRWSKTAAGAHEVRGRTLGIVGYGHIGSQISVLAEAVGMRVQYFDVVEKLPLGNARPARTLEELLGTSDCITLHVPATERTRGMIGAAEIARMREGAFLINNARGSVVDLDALAEALRSGRLGGAALDVYPDEPEANESAFDCGLAGLPNLLLTPHIGGSTAEAQAAIAREVTGKLARYLRTGATSSAVNVPEVDLPRHDRSQHRILHWHRNVPGVLSRLHRGLAELDVNINAEYLQSTPEISYVILDVDPDHAEAVRARVAEVPETIRVRTITGDGLTAPEAAALGAG